MKCTRSKRKSAFFICFCIRKHSLWASVRGVRHNAQRDVQRPLSLDGSRPTEAFRWMAADRSNPILRLVVRFLQKRFTRTREKRLEAEDASGFRFFVARSRRAMAKSGIL